ncbi:MAG: extracellular solute-binding protein family 1 [Paenibacillus sp.]|jgi:multiple sugar transport system substrate-binding protein|nr:extracellular solute-binding protein family 1 [Paenibacillus sp.]
MKTKSIKLLSSIIGVSLLAACGAGDKESGQPAQNADTKTPVKETKAVQPKELVFYNASNSTATVEAFLSSDQGKEITAKYPDLTIKLVATGKGMEPQEIIASGQPIDIIINSVFSYPVLLDAKLIGDISDIVKKYNYDLSRIEPTFIDLQRQLENGKVYGLPTANAGVALFYNKDIFDKFGVAYPKDGMTWDETYDLAKKLTRTDGGIKYFGFATRYPFMYNVNQLSLSYYDLKADKITVNNDKFKMFIENFARFEQIPGNEKVNTDSFNKEKVVAMMAYQSGKWDFDSWDMVSMPSFKDAPGVGPQGYGTYWNIASTSKNKDFAFEVLAYLTSDEIQKKYAKAGSIPVVTTPDVVKSFDQDGGRFKGKNVKAFFPSKRPTPSFVTKYDDAISKQMTAAYAAVAEGKKDANTALREAEEQAAKAIAAMK